MVTRLWPPRAACVLPTHEALAAQSLTDPPDQRGSTRSEARPLPQSTQLSGVRAASTPGLNAALDVQSRVACADACGSRSSEPHASPDTERLCCAEPNVVG